MVYAMSGTAARILTAVVLIPLVVSLVLWGPTWLVAIVVAGIILLALHEFFALGAKMNMPGYPKFTMVCALALVANRAFQMLVENWSGDFFSVFSLLDRFLGTPDRIIFYFVLGCGISTIMSRRGVAAALPDCAVSASGMLFIAWTLSRLIQIHSVGRELLLFTLVLVWVGDTAAFFVGRSMGRRLLAPTLSPKKTWEGADANVVASILVGFAFYAWGHFPLIHSLSIAILVSVVGQIGDLFESAWKRSAGVKDSGSLLPGHGGILDRIDALLLAAPVVWWYFSIFYSWQP
jgi:phosphatidate cytidylyltransferase